VISAFKLAHGESNVPFRVFMPQLGGLAANYTLDTTALALIAHHFLQWKHLTCSKSTFMMSVQDDLLPPSLSPFSAAGVGLLDLLADCVLQVDSFAGRESSVPVEFRFFCGFFVVHKLQQVQVHIEQLLCLQPILTLLPFSTDRISRPTSPHCQQIRLEERSPQAAH
jgi:hypothetical protein